MSLENAVIGLRAYNEVDERMSRLWQDINKAILLPRMDISKETLPSIHIQDVSGPMSSIITYSHHYRAHLNYEARQTKPFNLSLQTSSRSSLS